jgi:hypothetical protein
MPEAVPTPESTTENFESNYDSEKARASLEAAAWLEPIDFPETFADLMELSPEAMQEKIEGLRTQIDDLSVDEDGNLQNENRFTVELLAQRLHCLETAYTKSEFEAKKIFAELDPV